ncbi:MAG: hypothetical protein ACRDA8_10660 [Shewanella sp.]
MNIYVWERIEHCSDSYHEEGGVVVIAKSLDEAIAMAEGKGCKFTEHEAANPSEALEVAGGVEAVYIMQDAGCC